MQTTRISIIPIASHILVFQLNLRPSKLNKQKCILKINNQCILIHFVLPNTNNTHKRQKELESKLNKLTTIHQKYIFSPLYHAHIIVLLHPSMTNYLYNSSLKPEFVLVTKFTKFILWLANSSNVQLTFPHP
jgi:hypothetical protein